MRAQNIVEAYGKINIGLRVGAPEQDGFHPILGIFHSISLYDILTFSVDTSATSITIHGNFDCPLENTTIYRAIQEFSKETGIQFGVSVHVDKKIPVKAGLGGGSADAAATLLALDALLTTSLGTEHLAHVGRRIGSDVPFFFSKGAAVVSGRGEIVEGIQSRTDFFILLIQPAFGISTKWAYQALDALRNKESLIKVNKHMPFTMPSSGTAEKHAFESMFRNKPDTWIFKNDFEDALFCEYPSYIAFRKLLEKTQAEYISITGSGSCMYGIYSSEKKAESAKVAIEAKIAQCGVENALSGMILRVLKPLETSLRVI